MDKAPIRLRRLHAVTEADLDGLTQVLVDCVEGGASVSFMHPLATERARAFWQRVADGVMRGERVLLVAEDAQGIVGTVQLVFDLPENQPHRCDLAKMLVHRRARRQGVAAALLQEAEHEAASGGKSLMLLDTVTGSDAARLYARHGWQACGEVPDYALLPGGGLCATTFFFRRVQAA